MTELSSGPLAQLITIESVHFWREVQYVLNSAEQLIAPNSRAAAGR